MDSFEALRQTISRLTYYLKMMDDPDLLHLIISKGIDVAAGVLLDFVDRLKDVQQTFSIVSHSGTASRGSKHAAAASISPTSSASLSCLRAYGSR